MVEMLTYACDNGESTESVGELSDEQTTTNDIFESKMLQSSLNFWLFCCGIILLLFLAPSQAY